MKAYFCTDFPMYLQAKMKKETPTLLLESYRPADFSSKPNQTHLNQLITVFKATCSLQTGVLEQGWNWNLQDGSSPGAGLESKSSSSTVPDILNRKTNSVNRWHSEVYANRNETHEQKTDLRQL